jgi:hypothetical protein
MEGKIGAIDLRIEGFSISCERFGTCNWFQEDGKDHDSNTEARIVYCSAKEVDRMI